MTTQPTIQTTDPEATKENERLTILATSRTSRRTVLLAGSAIVLSACELPGGGGDDAGQAPDALAFTPDDVAIVDDGQGNTAPDNEGVLEMPDQASDQATPDGSTSTTAPGSSREPQKQPPASQSPATSPTTAAPKGSPTTATPATAAPTTVTTTPTTAAGADTIPGGQPKSPPTTGSGVSTTVPPTTAPTTSSTLPPPPPVATARHATSRLTFGITPGIDLAVMAMGVDGWIEDQLSRSGADPALEAQISSAGYQSLRNTNGQNRQQFSSDMNVLHRQVIHSNFVRARYSEHQLYEMMCQLWMDHFNISFEGGSGYYLPEYQETVIRPHAMGRFADLLVASANSGSMMKYLDNYISDARSGINENYGREVLELHSLGIDRAGNQIYTELDVVGAAKVLSGWSMNTDGNSVNFGAFVYKDERHSLDPVSLLGGQWSNAGLAGKAAGDNLLQFLARHPQTANYLCWKLCRRFVSDTPSEQLIANAAQVYLQNDTAIVPVLRYIFGSREFVESEGEKVRRPFELMTGALRAMGTDVPIESESDASHQLRNILRSLGHEHWHWETPDGYPDEARPWVNSSNLLREWNFTSRLTRNVIQNNNRSGSLETDVSLLRGSAATGQDLFDRIAFQCNLGNLPDALRISLMSTCGFEDGTPAASVSNDQLTELCTYLLAHPLFLLR